MCDKCESEHMSEVCVDSGSVCDMYSGVQSAGVSTKVPQGDLVSIFLSRHSSRVSRYAGVQVCACLTGRLRTASCHVSTHTDYYLAVQMCCCFSCACSTPHIVGGCVHVSPVLAIACCCVPCVGGHCFWLPCGLLLHPVLCCAAFSRAVLRCVRLQDGKGCAYVHLHVT